MRLNALSDLAVDVVALQDQDLAQGFLQPWLGALGAPQQHVADEQLDRLAEAVGPRAGHPLIRPCLEELLRKRLDVRVDLLGDETPRVLTIVAATAGFSPRDQNQQQNDQNDAERQHALRGHDLNPFRPASYLQHGCSSVSTRKIADHSRSTIASSLALSASINLSAKRSSAARFSSLASSISSLTPSSVPSSR